MQKKKQKYYYDVVVLLLEGGLTITTEGRRERRGIRGRRGVILSHTTVGG